MASKHYVYVAQYARPFGYAQRAQDALKNLHKVPSGLESVLLLLSPRAWRQRRAVRRRRRRPGGTVGVQLFAGFYNMQCTH